MSSRKVLVVSTVALLLAALAIAIAQDRPPTIIPYPGRFVIVPRSAPGGIPYLLDRWTGAIYLIERQAYFRLKRVDVDGE